ncbi:MAG: chemotaxis protein CheW [Gammaproteobacteria bacterium]|nr:chemotaxis protein CheW [Gammaproteobacteria bacterium]MDH5650361.1 chemotaxis protein CheW [Gammaproteobacteria bacterium]
MADIKYMDKSKGALPAGQVSAIHCLMIPMSSEILLLPNASIAEVIAYQEPEKGSDAVDWLLGRISWRDYRVPVVSFELVSGTDNKTGMRKGSRIAILNTLNGNSKLPYIGIVTQGIPHLQVVQEKNIIPNTPETEQSRFIKAYVLVNGEPASIPDIDALEKRLLL